ncbi:MAG: carboxypeptidase regulatory-like domain-containing protein [Planctomycetes bacterium]|nr:carboxypeptidase regulatory-like domain-containing protein [Planctomycetota bacterium]
MRRALLLLCLTATTAPAQEPWLIVEARGPARETLPSVAGEVRGRPSVTLPALGDLPPGTATAAATLRGQGGKDGRIRFAAAPGVPLPGAASGLVWTEDGLGALVVDLYANRAQRLQLAPMAELTTATGGELTVHARAFVPGRGAVEPFRRRGDRVRLPAGDYELWVQRGDEWLWQRRTLLSGESTVLAFDGPRQRVRSRSATTRCVFPAGRPDVAFAVGAAEFVLCGEARLAPLMALGDDAVFGPQVPIAGAGADAVAWPPLLPPAQRQRLGPAPLAAAPLAATLYSLLRTAAGSWRPLGAADRVLPATGGAAAPAPTFELPQPTDGDTWLLFTADGHAPQARPWNGAGGPFPFALERGVALQVVCRDEQGLPLVDVAVDYVPDGMEPATVAARTDARGTARLGQVLGPGQLRLVDARYANRTVALRTIPVEPLEVVVDEGEVLHGVARWPDGTPAAGVVVTLRDPSGALRPAERAVTSGADGAFVFPGLTGNRGVVLFAATKRDGRTWSGKLDRLRPGGGTVELVVRDEDPQLLPR